MGVLLSAALVGAVTGFLGVGGGFLTVPALMAFAGLTFEEAIGTSLFVIAISSAAGFLGHLGGSEFHVGLAASFAGAAVVGALLGMRIARGVSLERLRAGFALFVGGVGVSVAAASLLRVVSIH